MSRLLKFLHELGSYGLAGGFVVQLLLLSRREKVDIETQKLVEHIALWVVTPSFLAVVVSGLLAMMVRPVFFSKGWVWFKIFLTAPTLYITVATLGLTNIPMERVRSSLWLAMVLLVIITAFSVWRPKHFLISGRAG